MKKLILSLLILAPTIQAKNLLILDTYLVNEYAYNNFESISENAGFNTELLQFINILNKDFNKYDAIFVLISSEFMNNTNNLIVKKCINKLKEFCANPGKLIGLIFPNNTITPEQFLKAKKLITKFELLSSIQRQKLKKIINAFLLINFNKDKTYATAIESLKKTKSEAEKIEEKFETFEDKENNLIATFLPMNQQFSKKIDLPFGLYIKNSGKNNHIFISKMPILFFSELSESFKVNPISKEIRKDLNNAIEQTLKELLSFISDEKSCTKKIPEIKNDKLKKEIVSQREKFLNQEIYKWTQNGIWCAWVDLDAYDGEFLEIGINNILKSNINLLWIRFLPELYLSKNAISSEKKEEYLQKINRFTKALKEKFALEKKVLPKIFIGVEITGNFKKLFPCNSMKDIFAKNYSKIPAPLDFENFWQVELLNVFDEFIEIWNKEIGNGLSIDGVFLDFEMYHAQDQESSFNSFSDFSDNAFQIYLKKTNQQIELADIKNRINYLYKNNKLNEYFDSLKKEANEIGKKIKNHIKSKLPNSIIGVYMAHLPSSWFYIGILAGLSTKEEPIILATFNNEFFKHYNWFIENNIYAFHISAILLSKFKDEKSFELINYLKEDHDGIWYNRFSRLGKKYEEEKWWSNESTPFEHEKVIKAIANSTHK